jgi:hypothetical protein
MCRWRHHLAGVNWLTVISWPRSAARPMSSVSAPARAARVFAQTKSSVVAARVLVAPHAVAGTASSHWWRTRTGPLDAVVPSFVPSADSTACGYRAPRWPLPFARPLGRSSPSSRCGNKTERGRSITYCRIHACVTQVRGASAQMKRVSRPRAAGRGQRRAAGSGGPRAAAGRGQRRAAAGRATGRPTRRHPPPRRRFGRARVDHRAPGLVTTRNSGHAHYLSARTGGRPRSGHSSTSSG